MTPRPDWIASAIALLNLFSAFLICRSLSGSLLRLPNLRAAQLWAAEGILLSFSFILAGTVLKTLLIHQWDALFKLVAILAIRNGVKRSFAWQKSALEKARPRQD